MASRHATAFVVDRDTTPSLISGPMTPSPTLPSSPPRSRGCAPPSASTSPSRHCHSRLAHVGRDVPTQRAERDGVGAAEPRVSAQEGGGFILPLRHEPLRAREVVPVCEYRASTGKLELFGTRRGGVKRSPGTVPGYASMLALITAGHACCVHMAGALPPGCQQAGCARIRIPPPPRARGWL